VATIDAPGPAGSPGDFQREIYLRGMAGETPELPLEWHALERAAHAAMTPEAADWVAGGAGSEDTMLANREAFARWRIVPRMLRGVGRRDLSTTVCGTPMPAPVLLAPIGAQSLVHEEGDTAVARAASSLGVPFVLSTAASSAIERVADAAGAGPRWFQLYWPRDRDLAASLVRRAEHAGYGALVVTLDTWTLGWRPRDLQRGHLPFLRGEGLANYLSDPVFTASLPGPPERHAELAALRWGEVSGDPTLTWSDLGFLRQVTSMPILLKGICDATDARRALAAGVDGLIVSNHGGRQVDGAIAALDALPRVVDMVAGAVPVLFDSGVRCAADALKALALGARAVLLGRLYLWGLALAGEPGVRQVLRAFLAELDLSLALSGYARPSELSPDALQRAS
jgi:lactate 2-monooxygenase